MKIFRTYIGGNKKNELLLFKQIIDNNNWVKYLEQFVIFSNDIILTYKSRIYFLKILCNVLFIISILLTLFQQYLQFIVLFVISCVFYYIKIKITQKLSRILLLNEFTINTIKIEIRRIYNI